jgi:DNA-directed RNA polymerase subunit RPC12/RpoP
MIKYLCIECNTELREITDIKELEKYDLNPYALICDKCGTTYGSTMVDELKEVKNS